MLDNKNELNKLLVECLVNFQLLEQALKDWVLKQHSIIELKLGDEFAYKILLDKEYINKFKNAGLGTVLKEFKRLNDNDELIKEADKIVRYRNEIAHTAFLRAHKCKSNDDYTIQELSKLRGVNVRLENCLVHVISEVAKQAVTHCNAIPTSKKNK